MAIGSLPSGMMTPTSSTGGAASPPPSPGSWARAGVVASKQAVASATPSVVFRMVVADPDKADGTRPRRGPHRDLPARMARARIQDDERRSTGAAGHRGHE